jgi:hypothetical protein
MLFMDLKTLRLKLREVIAAAPPVFFEGQS